MVEQEGGLHHNLTPAQLAMIGIGSTIGTGLFLGSAISVKLAGPAVILSFVGGRARADDVRSAQMPRHTSRQTKLRITAGPASFTEIALPRKQTRTDRAADADHGELRRRQIVMKTSLLLHHRSG